MTSCKFDINSDLKVETVYTLYLSVMSQKVEPPSALMRNIILEWPLLKIKVSLLSRKRLFINL